MINDGSPSNLSEYTKTDKKLMQSDLTARARQISASNESIHRHVRILGEQERVDTKKWLCILDHVYDDLYYSPSQHDRTSFRERLKENLPNHESIRTTAPSIVTSTLNNTQVIVLEELIDTKAAKYSDVGDAKN
ncbi:unnamed protein product [Rotaria magnacalcarata]|uniref:Uncharacterized protein n=1 Tax=Rotaria magnacalcarata TaxID=392030 RepID=A0A820D5H5_9BILA|nr:unnamed protein product [Rotaria magnacalcarata]CAF1503114.1 unnamed protein product [Rotaria magnacalcarata]CAF2009205.1 unnamed protein product [Rotaria magnacalcarata]CAF2029623.1 unnamed protein product [Rotaria magnacalcarata]CAF2181786.1 unnamed protein product [Rotaria magnacalcarata]